MAQMEVLEYAFPWILFRIRRSAPENDIIFYEWFHRISLVLWVKDSPNVAYKSLVEQNGIAQNVKKT